MASAVGKSQTFRGKHERDDEDPADYSMQAKVGAVQEPGGRMPQRSIQKSVAVVNPSLKLRDPMDMMFAERHGKDSMVTPDSQRNLAASEKPRDVQGREEGILVINDTDCNFTREQVAKANALYEDIMTDLDNLTSNPEKDADEEKSLDEIINLLKILESMDQQQQAQGGGNPMQRGGGKRLNNVLRKIYDFSRIARGCITINAIRILLVKLSTILFNKALGSAVANSASISMVVSTVTGWTQAAAGVSPIGAALGPYLGPVLGFAMVSYGLNKVTKTLMLNMSPEKEEALAQKLKDVRTEILRENLAELNRQGEMIRDTEEGMADAQIKLIVTGDKFIRNLEDGHLFIPDIDDLVESTVKTDASLTYLKSFYDDYISLVYKLGGFFEDILSAGSEYVVARKAAYDKKDDKAADEAYNKFMYELKLCTVIVSLSGADLGASLAANTGFTVLATSGNVAQVIATVAGVAAFSRGISRKFIKIIDTTHVGSQTVYANAGVPKKVFSTFVGFLIEDMNRKEAKQQQKQKDFNKQLVDGINGVANGVLEKYTVQGTAVLPEAKVEQLEEAQKLALSAVTERGIPEDPEVEQVVAVLEEITNNVVGEMESVMDENVGGGSRRRRKNNKPRKRKTLRKKSKRRKSTKRNSRKTTVRRKSRRLSRKSKRLSRK